MATERSRDVSSPPPGTLAIVLHAHLPWVGHGPPGRPTLEERWVLEALSDCYLPLIEVLASAHELRPGAPLLTLSVSPTLACLLREPTLPQRFSAWLDSTLAELAAAALERPELGAALADQRARMERARATFFGRARSDVVGALARLEELGAIELATTAATHAFLPSLRTRAAVRAQLRMGRRYFAKLFGRAPRALWLPECGFDARLDADIAGSGARYAVLEAHGVELARPRPPLGRRAPILSPNGVAYFPRDVDLVEHIWSAKRGYPGDPAYRDFHAELPPRAGAIRSGLKPFAVTGHADKGAYEPARAAQRVALHAEDFVARAKSRLAPSQPDDPRVSVVAFDAELFGHFWWEGPAFLGRVLAAASGRDGAPLATSLGAFLSTDPSLAVANPQTSSWGEGGFAEVWTAPESAHLLRSSHRAEQRVLAVDAAVRDTPRTQLQRSARLRAIRELFLLQASDHAFMMFAGSFSDRAERLAREHAELVETLTRLALTGPTGPGDAAAVARSKELHPLFEELDEDAWADTFEEWQG
jgi:1,4-alpha-glucan branching enzyme